MGGSPRMIRTIYRIQPAEPRLLCMSLISTPTSRAPAFPHDERGPKKPYCKSTSAPHDGNFVIDVGSHPLSETWRNVHGPNVDGPQYCSCRTEALEPRERRAAQLGGGGPRRGYMSRDRQCL